MFTLVDHKHYHQEAMYCPTCGWEGQGYQLKQSEEIELLNIREVYCPACSRYMGQFSTGMELQEENLQHIPLPQLDWL